MQRIHNRRYLKSYRRALRRDATPAESYLWKLLKNRQLLGRKFRRQHSIGPYIVDFYCAQEQLVVELDGSVHDDALRMEYEEVRQRYLDDLRLVVLRFGNQEVLAHVDLVAEAIAQQFRT